MTTSPQEFYNQQIDFYTKQVAAFSKKETANAFARLGVFVAAILAFVFLYRFSIVISLFTGLCGLIWFGYLVRESVKIQRKLEVLRKLLRLNEDELNFQDLKFPETYTGSEFGDYNHSYSSDLNIVGRGSMFHYLNRSFLQLSREMLALWLSAPAPVLEISMRQDAVKELAKLSDLRQTITIEGSFSENSKKGILDFMEWLKMPALDINSKSMKYLVSAVGIIAIALILLVIFVLPSVILIPFATVTSIIIYINQKKISALHDQLTGFVALLKSYSTIIKLIENQNFSSKKLEIIRHAFIEKNQSASKSILEASKILDFFDMKFNWLIYLPLNLLFLYDFHIVFLLEKWKAKNATKIPIWFHVISEFECLSALGNAAFNNPENAFPQLITEGFVLEATKMAHPLIDSQKRKANDFAMDEKTRMLVLTGSNMSGKSTFLRTLGINVVLAMTGASVCAQSMKISAFAIYTSMIIKDSLEENISTFYAELLRIKRIIELSAENGNHLFLIDEPLRGTNSQDRLLGNKALIRQLVENNSAGIIATHDLALSEMESNLPGKVINYHFDVQIKDKELYFDYQLHHGICQSRNASILMEKIGIRMDWAE